MWRDVFALPPAATHRARLMDGTDVGVVDPGRSFGFAQKALAVFLVAGEFLREEFQGDGALEAGVLGFVDHAHAALAELREDLVVGDGGADHR